MVDSASQNEIDTSLAVFQWDPDWLTSNLNALRSQDELLEEKIKVKTSEAGRASCKG